MDAPGGMSAGELATELGLARSNVSGDLNRLCDGGKAVKDGSKPVLYRAVPPQARKRESIFDRFSRIMPSLYQACEQAKAAVLYPPSGMPMLLIGETGVGKSKFAETIFEYARESKRLREDAPFVVFNCADYANNPQLLVSQLFGCRKGAFTGADSDKPGLIEKASGGVLFLDEVHRLPPEGQEMLFTFFDRGCFRRLGDSDAERRADTMIITATTEQPASALLRTFTRRIPMVIRIPSLAERGFDERFALVKIFFTDESRRLGKPIRVSVNAARALLAYPCPNNLGQLRSDIQLLCAKAYSDYLSKGASSLEIATGQLPASIKEGLVTETCHRRLWNSLTDLGSRLLSFDAEAVPTVAWRDTDDEGVDSVYDLIDVRMQALAKEGADPGKIVLELDADIRSFFGDGPGEQGLRTDDRIRGLVGDDIASAVEGLLAVAEIRLGSRFTPSVHNGLAIHVFNLAQRLSKGRPVSGADAGTARKLHPDEFAVAVECVSMLESALGLPIPFAETGSIATFLALSQADSNIMNRPAIVLMAHGETTASSMAAACNGILGLEVVYGIDMPLNENPRAAYARLKDGLARRQPKSDVVLLVDMGALVAFGQELQGDLDVSVKTIPFASTMHVLQAARKSLLGLSAERIYEETVLLSPSGDEETGLDAAADGIVVAICTTGEGSAAYIKSRLESALDEDGLLVRVETIGAGSAAIASEKVRALETRGRVYCVVSPFDLGLPYPAFGLDEVLDDEGLRRITALVREEGRFDKIVAAHEESMTSVRAREAFEAARAFVLAAEESIDCELYDGVRIGVYCHIAAAIDRAKHGDAAPPFPDIKRFKSERRDVFDVVRHEAISLESRFGVRLSDDDACYIALFFDPDNCVIASLSPHAVS